MKKTLLFTFAAFTALAVNAAKNFEITTSGENLRTLTKVTDNEEPCMNPFGGEFGNDLFFAARENKKFWNIYKKDNVFSTAMTQKTSGKNHNWSPCYNKQLDKIAFRCQNEGSSTSDIFLMNNTKGKTLQAITESPDAYRQWLYAAFQPRREKHRFCEILLRCQELFHLDDGHGWRQPSANN